jgi:hypothetical protein
LPEIFWDGSGVAKYWNEAQQSTLTAKWKILGKSGKLVLDGIKNSYKTNYFLLLKILFLLSATGIYAQNQ